MTLDNKDRINSASFGYGSNWNQRMCRDAKINNNVNRYHPNYHHNQKQQQQQLQQQKQQKSYMLDNLSSAEEDNMSGMTVDTAFRTSSSSKNSQSEIGNSGGSSVNQSLVSLCASTSTDASEDRINISKDPTHNQSQIGEPQHDRQQKTQPHRQERLQTLTTGNKSISGSQPSRYSTQTVSNTSFGDCSSSDGSCSHHYHSQSHDSLPGNGNGSRGRHGGLLMTHKKHQSCRSKAMTIYSQSKARRRQQSPPKESEEAGMIVKEISISSKTLTTCASTGTFSVGAPDTVLLPPSARTTPSNDHRARIKGEIAHLSYELATTNSNVDQTYVKMRNYMIQAEQFESLAKVLQKNIAILMMKLDEDERGGDMPDGLLGRSVVDSNRAYTQSDTSAVEEVNSVEEPLGSRSGSATASERLTTTQQQQLPLASSAVTEVNVIIPAPKIPSATAASDAVPRSGTYSDTDTLATTMSLDRRKSPRNSTDTGMVCTAAITPTTTAKDQRKASHNSTSAVVTCKTETTPTTTLQDQRKESPKNTDTIVGCMVATTSTTTLQDRRRESTDATVTCTAATATSFQDHGEASPNSPDATLKCTAASSHTTAVRNRRKASQNSTDAIVERMQTKKEYIPYQCRRKEILEEGMNQQQLERNCAPCSSGNHQSAAQTDVIQNSKNLLIKARGGRQPITSGGSYCSMQSTSKKGIERLRQGNGTTTNRNRIKLTKKDDSNGGKMVTETRNLTSRRDNVAPDHEVFSGDPFATVDGYNGDGLEIVDQAVLSYDLVKRRKADDRHNISATRNSDNNNRDTIKVSSTWSSLFRRLRQSDTHSRKRYPQPMKKHRIFRFD